MVNLIQIVCAYERSGKRTIRPFGPLVSLPSGGHIPLAELLSEDAVLQAFQISRPELIAMIENRMDQRFMFLPLRYRALLFVIADGEQSGLLFLAWGRRNDPKHASYRESLLQLLAAYRSRS